MKVIKLKKEHELLIKPLFFTKKFMGSNSNTQFSADFYHEVFVTTYMSNLNNYHAYGVQDNKNNIVALLGFYESDEEPCWYWNQVRTLGNNKNEIKMLLDKVIEHNELNGRCKFYSMFPIKYRKIYRKLAFSNFNNERYDYFDEYYIKSNYQTKFSLAWQILYNRSLVTTDTIVRCTFLKQKYRQELFDGGNL